MPDDTTVKTQLRIERPLWQRAVAVAKRLRMSTNAYVCNAVEAAVKADEERLEAGRKAGMVEPIFYPTGGLPADRCCDKSEP